jgi:dolichyl-phosphate beta-glucosyltransferase
VVRSFINKGFAIELITGERNRGKGFAIKTGMLKTRGDYALFTDADMSTPVEMFERFEPYMSRGVDVIIGTRKTRDSYVGKHQPFYRETMGKVFTLLSNSLLGLQVTDFTCGFKCFHSRTIEPVFGSQRIFGWGYDTEIILIASRKGFRVQEVPVNWFNDEATRVRLLKNVFTCLEELYQIYKYDRRGFYRL